MIDELNRKIKYYAKGRHHHLLTETETFFEISHPLDKIPICAHDVMFFGHVSVMSYKNVFMA